MTCFGFMFFVVTNLMCQKTILQIVFLVVYDDLQNRFTFFYGQKKPPQPKLQELYPVKLFLFSYQTQLLVRIAFLLSLTSCSEFCKLRLEAAMCFLVSCKTLSYILYSDACPKD